MYQRSAAKKLTVNNNENRANTSYNQSRSGFTRKIRISGGAKLFANSGKGHLNAATSENTPQPTTIGYGSVGAGGGTPHISNINHYNNYNIN
jgi:hypothetical protein